MHCNKSTNLFFSAIFQIGAELEFDPILCTAEYTSRNLSLRMGLMSFKHIPLSWKFLLGFSHQCATRWPPQPSPFHLCHPWSHIWPKCLVPWWLMDNPRSCSHRCQTWSIVNCLDTNNSKCELLIINHTNSNKLQTKLLGTFPTSLNPKQWQLLE